MTTHDLSAGGFNTLNSVVTIYKKSDIVTGEDRSFTAFITNVDSGEFEKAVEYKNVFGNGYIPIIKNMSPIEVTIDFTAQPTDAEGINSIADFIMTRNIVTKTGLQVLEPIKTHDPCKIKVEWKTTPSITTNTEAFKKIYYNAYATKISHSAEADGKVEGTITFTVSPFDDTGTSNYYEFLLTSDYSGNPDTDWTTFEETLDTAKSYSSV